MKINLKFILFFAIYFAACNQPIKKDVQSLALIPEPQSVAFEKGAFEFGPDCVLCYEDSAPVKQSFLELLVHQLQEDGFGVKSILPEKEQRNNSICFRLQDNPLFVSDEGYRLKIGRENIQITARTIKGLFYGFQSLRQILLTSEKTTEETRMLRCIDVYDSPKFPWRGMLLDCCRHFMSKEKIKQYIDVLAFYKMNRLHWHLTEDQGWRIEIKQFPELTQIGAYRTEKDGSVYGGYYSQDDIREIVAYAADRHIDVVPEIELPGHSLAALATYPQLSCTGGPFEVANDWGVFKDIYCAGNDSVFTFLHQVLDEVCALFPFEYIHIGGDEAPKFRWENCRKCQERIANEGLKDEHELQSWFIQEIETYLANKGKRIIGWDEILEGGLAEQATVQSWRGFDGAMEAAKSGHDAIVSPTSHAYFDYPIETTDLKKVYSFNPVPEGLDSVYHHHILGGECNMWTERVTEETIDKKVFPRLLAMSEALWSGTSGKPYADFHERISRHYPILRKMNIDYGYESQAIAVEARFDSSTRTIRVDLVPGQNRTAIYYTLDGSQPDTLSDRFNQTITIHNSCQLKALAYLPSLALQQYAVAQFEINKATGADVKLSYPFSPNYTGTIYNALTDGIRGSLNFHDGHWQGFYGTDLVATIDLGQKKSFQSLRAGFLQSMPSWIFMPRKITVSASDDGVNFHDLGSFNPWFDLKSKDTFIEDFRIDFGHTGARFVRMHAYSIGKNPEWHDAAGSPSWLFCDEIVLE